MSKSADVPVGGQCISPEATHAMFGEATDGTDTLVLALSDDDGQELALFMSREAAAEVFDLFCVEMRERGWLQ